MSKNKIQYFVTPISGSDDYHTLSKELTDMGIPHTEVKCLSYELKDVVMIVNVKTRKHFSDFDNSEDDETLQVDRPEFINKLKKYYEDPKPDLVEMYDRFEHVSEVFKSLFNHKS